MSVFKNMINRLSTYAYFHVLPDGNGLAFSTRNNSLIFINEPDMQRLCNNELGQLSSATLRMLSRTGIGSKSAEEDEVNEYQKFRETELGASIDITIFLTMQCNCNCLYCYEKGVDRNAVLSQEQINDFIEWLSDRTINNLKLPVSICFHGGEPLLEPVLIAYICDHISLLRVNPVYSVVTNGTLLTEPLCLELRDHKINRLMITIDGDEKIHDHQRPLIGGGSSHKLIMKGLAALRNLNDWKPRIEVSVNLSPKFPDALVGCVESLRPLADLITQVTVSCVTDYGNLKDGDVFSIDDWATTQSDAIFYLLEKGFNVTAPLIPQICPLGDSTSFILSPNGFGPGCIAEVGRPESIRDSHRIAESSHHRCRFYPVCGGGCAASPSDRCLLEYFEAFMPLYLDRLYYTLGDGKVIFGKNVIYSCLGKR